jgi:hypothetical protein
MSNYISEAIFIFDGNLLEEAEKYADEIFDFICDYGDHVTIEEVSAVKEETEVLIKFLPFMEDPSDEEWLSFINQIEREFSRITFKKIK